MSTLKTNNVQVGQSVTATNNFTIYQPSTPDGTVRIGVGNSGATTADVASLSSSGNFSFNSGYGSVATAYGCRAWVNFNGTGTVAIRASGNVSSITDNGTGDYTVNFTNALVDTNYVVVVPSMMTGGNTSEYFGVLTPSNNSYSTKTTSAVRLAVYNTLVSNQDVFDANVAVFR
jgi:hypothetical protein